MFSYSCKVLRIRDVRHLKNNPLFKDILEGNLASQSIMPRFENSIELKTLFDLFYAWIECYLSNSRQPTNWSHKRGVL